MKKTIPFTKEISFKTRIAEIVDIEVTHNLEKTPFNTIEGSFLVKGKYKMHEASQIEDDFSYDLPFTIEVDDKYNIEDAGIKISDFYFEIINEDILKVNVEIELSNVKEKEELVLERCYDEEESVHDEINEVEELENIIEQVNVIEPIDIKDATISESLDVSVDIKQRDTDIFPVNSKMNLEEKLNTQRPITDIFTSINNDEDTFKTYHVYIVRENDTVEAILEKYNITKEELGEYNNLNDIKIGSKLILPCSCNE